MKQLKDVNGTVLFEADVETAKELIELAMKNSISLSGAYLSMADLSRADLSWADLRGADLSKANLSRADLSKANLYRADLSGAYLLEANLSKADLSRADLSGVNLSEAYLSNTHFGEVEGQQVTASSPITQIDAYHITVFDNHIKIGCEFHTIDNWFSFGDNRILEMGGERALTFWRTWKPILKQICKGE